MFVRFKCRYPATSRQSLRQPPRRKAAVHLRWCALRLARLDKSLLGEGVKNNWFWHTKIILQQFACMPVAMRCRSKMASQSDWPTRRPAASQD